MPLEIWDVWYPNAGARGLSYALGAMEHNDNVWLHAAPDALRIEVRTPGGERIAFADQLTRTGDYFPMTRIVRTGNTFAREDRWPTDADVGAHVLLPGGEVGVLKSWWNAADGSEWRWNIEFYNHK
jgi:hypothetical protein